jgi:hypothetical protein
MVADVGEDSKKYNQLMNDYILVGVAHRRLGGNDEIR